jgi:hypothetical protein
MDRTLAVRFKRIYQLFNPEQSGETTAYVRSKVGTSNIPRFTRLVYLRPKSVAFSAQTGWLIWVLRDDSHDPRSIDSILTDQAIQL